MKKKKVMLVASSGGHWIQLNRLLPAFDGCEKIFITTESKYRVTVGDSKFLLAPDASRWNKLRVLYLALIMLKHVIIIRPDVVVSTGAAPGFFALFFGKKFGAKTIWLDSIANVDQLSLSGQKIQRHADMWLTQWEHLATPSGPQYLGAVL
ncbi:MAG: UDP-N-acetylglucosamine--LPS N-acetylglucosamine transferase [Desulforhopalus sp.]